MQHEILSWHTLFSFFLLVSTSRRYELEGPFSTTGVNGSGSADYAFMILFGGVGILATYPFVRNHIPLQPLFATNLIYYVLYIWSKRHPNAPVRTSVLAF